MYRGVDAVIFQSTHPLRGATTLNLLSRRVVTISIHAPLAGCDPTAWPRPGWISYFNPRTPCGVRLLVGEAVIIGLVISIHAPLAGCDHFEDRFSPDRCHFNPRTPCGVRPALVTVLSAMTGISIHAPLAGCDAGAGGRTRATRYFNPRTPCGVRPAPCGAPPMANPISIHAPLAGCDPPRQPWIMSRARFQSTHPLRGATGPVVQHRRVEVDFNPRTPCGVRPKTHAAPAYSGINFNPRTPCGVRHPSGGITV